MSGDAARWLRDARKREAYRHGEDFILAPEEQLTHITTWAGKPVSELIHADMIYCELPEGGELFAVGSITFCGNLSWNNFDNNISRILHNVLSRMLDLE